MNRTDIPLLPASDALPLFVVQQDAHLLFADKPAGMLAVPGRGPDKQDCLLSHLQAHDPAILLVHRLDQATSGLMVFARSPAVQKRLSVMFSSREIRKRYLATVHGYLQPERGTIDLPLMADWPQRPRQKVDLQHGKPSQTRWQRLDYDPVSDTSRVQLSPVTGRTHQLRVHMMAIGHPIVGDTLYGPPAVAQGASEGASEGVAGPGGSAGLADADKAPRMLLHAQALSLPHPVSGEWLEIVLRP